MNNIFKLIRVIPNMCTRNYSLDKIERSINQVVLLGRVGVNPQLRGTEKHPVTIFTLATTTTYKDPSGDVQQKTEWHRISVFMPFLRDNVYNYLKKGQRCLVKGKIAYGQTKDANGVLHPSSTIVADDVIFFTQSSQAAEDMESAFTTESLK